MLALSKARERVLPHAEHSGDRAYCFVQTRRGLVEVRVWPGGRTTYTLVDTRGLPTGPARQGQLRAGGVRAQNWSSPRVLLGGGLGLIVAELLSRLLL